MTLKFRTEDLDRWGAGLGRNLHPLEVDENFWELLDRVSDLEALPSAPPAITEFEVVGDTFYVHFDDSTTLGPYLLPSTLLNPITWTPNTVVSRMDTFSMNGVLYVVVLDHTTDDEFDPGANNGLGDDYYFAMLTAPGNSLPTGGAAGMILTKSTSSDYAVTWSWKTPSDGTAGKYLRQMSSTQDDSDWATISADEVAFTPVTGSLLTSSNVADALEELAGGTILAADSIPFTPVSGSSLTSDNVADALEELATVAFAVNLTVAASDESTALTTGTAKITFRMPHLMFLTEVRASLSTAQSSGSVLTVDVNKAGSTILSTKLTVDNGEKTSTTATTPAVISDATLADDAEITIDIDQVGDGTAKGLKVTLIGTR